MVALIDESVRVPIYARAGSLNLAAAAAICLYAGLGAHRRAPGGHLTERETSGT